MSQSTDPATLRFYEVEAEEYCRRTGSFPSIHLAEFLSFLPPGASILELGCGSGRDTAEMIRLGYDVTPTDGSEEVARQAARRLNRTVTVLEFSDLQQETRFDGVWAQACLLHVPIGHLPDVLSRIHHALRSPGVLFASFKEGKGEGRDQFGRYFNYPSSEMLGRTFEEAASWAGFEISQSSGRGYDGEPATWLECKAFR